MADEFFRPFFGSGVWAQGEPVPGLWYNAVMTNNYSSLGVKSSQLDRTFSTGASVWWMPTTKEFGPRGGYGDWEQHEKVATRFGFSTTRSPEQRFTNASTGAPTTPRIRLADSVNVFDTGALAPGVTVDKVDYRILSFDAGMKYRGIFLQTEIYNRWLDDFKADGPLPVDSIHDAGFYVQARVLSGEEEARGLRRDVADLRRQGRRVRQQQRVPGRRELLRRRHAQPPAQRAADRTSTARRSAARSATTSAARRARRSRRRSRCSSEGEEFDHDTTSIRLTVALGGRSWWLALALRWPRARRGRSRRRAMPAQFHDSHFHLTNYIQEGITVRDFLRSWGPASAGRRCSASRCSSSGRTRNSGDFAPTYYLHSDAPLYYYSFTDAYIAAAYRALPQDAAGALRSDDHRASTRPTCTASITSSACCRPSPACSPASASSASTRSSSRRRSRARPPASPIPRSIASSTSPASRAWSVILHNDIDMPFAKVDAEPVYLTQTKALLKRHPKATIIWAHTGLGRIVHPVQVSAAAGRAAARRTSRFSRRCSTDPALAHVIFDISWDEVAKYAVSSPESIARVGGDVQPLSRPLPVRHRHRGAGECRAVLPRLRHVGAGVAAPDARGQPQGSRWATTSACSTRRGGRVRAVGRPLNTRNEVESCKFEVGSFSWTVAVAVAVAVEPLRTQAKEIP